MIDLIRNSTARVMCLMALPGAMMLTTGCAQFRGASPSTLGATPTPQTTATAQASTTQSPTIAQAVGTETNAVPTPSSDNGTMLTAAPAEQGFVLPGAPAPSTADVAQVSAVGPQAAGQQHVVRQVPNTVGVTSPPPGTVTPNAAGQPAATVAQGGVFSPMPGIGGPRYRSYQGPRVREADLVINGFPARTGRIMLGGAVNSDAGLTGQLTIDERNFDILRWPRSFRDLFGGNAFRGAGQTLRVEAAPGTDFKRYTLQFADPNILGYKPVSMSVSGFLYDRRFDDWDEERLGGRLAFGYRISPDLSISFGISGQNVRITRPRASVPELDAVANRNNELYGGEISLIHDTRNSPIQASRGHYFQFKFEEMFGRFDYARFELEYRKYWLITERADESGKQTLSYSVQLGFSGNDTPIFENFFAGGYATIRGFDFRGAGPVDPATGVELGGQFQWLNTVEYMFPITADDAFRGVAFVDFGTVEPDVSINDFRVAPGLGLRVAIPMLGPAPLAFDFAYPVTKADTDRRRIFSFYMSLIR